MASIRRTTCPAIWPSTRNPRNGQCRPSIPRCSASPQLGTIGQRAAPLLLRPGPGKLRYGTAKGIAALREGKTLQFRVEAFNVFNHAQFFGAAAVNGNISSAGFGQIVNAMPPRQVQLALRFNF